MLIFTHRGGAGKSGGFRIDSKIYNFMNKVFMNVTRSNKKGVVDNFMPVYAMFANKHQPLS